MNSVLFVGLDVDDKAFHVCARNSVGEKEFQFSCKPSIGALQKGLAKNLEAEREIQVFYEATYLGFSLYRDLHARGISCQVIAPSLTPVIPGERVKTNRLDCEKLSEYGSKGQLAAVHVPSAEEEVVRDLVRARKFLTDQLRRHKQQLIALCRRMGLNYRSENPSAHYWTQAHFTWLSHQVKYAFHPVLKFTLGNALDQVKQLQVTIKTYEEEIRKQAEQPFYRRKAQALCCFRGIDLVTAMTLISELGDPDRFAHPSQLTSYAGMDLIEYTSGKERRWSMTKMGNRHVRTAVVEACQSAWRVPRLSKRLKKQSEGIDHAFLEIAGRCMHRLYKKSNRLIARGKEKNKVKVACARELLSFVWEALKAAA